MLARRRPPRGPDGQQDNPWTETAKPEVCWCSQLAWCMLKGARSWPITSSPDRAVLSDDYLGFATREEAVLSTLSAMLLVLSSPAVCAGSEHGVTVTHLKAPPVAGLQDGEGNGEKADDLEESPASPASPVPEAATLLLVGSGLVGLALTRRRSRRAGARSQGPAR